MPLPAPDCARQASHCRSITVQSYRRSDGLWDIEGHLSDIWPDPVPRAGDMLPGGQPMHAMWLRLTLDRSATIVAVQAVTDAGPYGSTCGAIAAMSCPCHKTCPPVGAISRSKPRPRVDLPQPLSPTTPSVLPASSVKDTSRTMGSVTLRDNIPAPATG